MRLIAFLAFLFSSICFAQVVQQAATATDPQAVSLVQNATTSQLGTNSIQDVQLSGTVSVSDGTSSGTITLSADTAGHSKVILNLNTGTISEFSSGPGEEPTCSWTDSKGISHDIPIHNCWNNGAWFMPTLPLATALASGKTAFTYGGNETVGNATIQHLSSTRPISKGKSSTLTLIQKLSHDDLSLDATTHLPTSLKFLTHPDNDAKADIPVEIKYSDYRDVNGVKIPFHIQKLVNGSTYLDITISSATFNNGPVTK